MRKNHSRWIAIAASVFVACGSMAGAQVSLTNGSPTYSQTFDTLIPTGTAVWTDNSTLANWYAARAAGGSFNIIAGNGSAAGGGVYSFGTGTATERALGSVGSGTPNGQAYGVRMKNNGTTAITALQIQYTGEQWRDGGNTNPHKLTVYYRTSSSPITAADPGTGAVTPPASPWVAAGAAFDFTGPFASATSGPIDGNTPAAQANINASLPVTLAPGDEIMVEWWDPNDTGNDHGLAIDNLTITATFASPADTWTTNVGGVTFDDGGFTPVDSTHAPFTKTVTVDATGTTVISSVTGLTGNFSFSGAVPPLGTTLNNGDSQVLTFVYNPTVNDGSTEPQQTATINATTGSPASRTVTLDGGVVRDTTIAAWRTYVEAGNPVAGIKWKMTNGTVSSNTLRPSPTQNVITVQDRVDGDPSTRGFYVFDNAGAGGALPPVGASVAVYGTAVKFQGLWEIVPDRPHATGGITPSITPVPVLASDLNDSTESVLVRVNSASVAVGTIVTANTLTSFTTANGGLDVQVFSDNTTVNQPINAGQGYDIIGIGYQSDAANNFNSGGVGYRLLPRLNSDFITPATSVSTWSLY